MQFSDLAGDRQPESIAAHSVFGARRFSTIETIKNVREISVRYTWMLVFHFSAGGIPAEQAEALQLSSGRFSSFPGGGPSHFEETLFFLNSTPSMALMGGTLTL